MNLDSEKPILRFKHEEGGDFPKWQDLPFSSIATLVRTPFNPSKGERVDYECIELESLSQDTGKLLLTFSPDQYKSSKNRFEIGDVLFGKLRPYLRKFWFAKFQGVCSSEIWIFRPVMVSGCFLFQLVQTRRFGDAANIQSGTKMPRSDWNIVSSTILSIPSAHAEQQKIADFLSAIDDKIELLSQKKSILEQYKRGLMQKLFNQELRFKDDQGREYSDWYTVRLNDIAEVLRGSGLSKSDLVNGGKYPCILYGELFTKYAETIQEVHSFTNEHSPVIGKYGDILMPTSDVTPDGLATACALLLNGVQLGGDINIIRLQPSNHPVFVAYMLNFFKHQIVRLVSGTTVKHIYPRDIRSLELFLPRIHEEQQRIADFLSAIDWKIELVNTQIEKTRTFKQGLLQQLFV